MTSQASEPSAIAVQCDQGVVLFIEPPVGWIMVAPAPPAQLTLSDPNAWGPVSPRINVAVQDLGNLTTEEFLTLSRLQIKAMGARVYLEFDQPTNEAHGKHFFQFQSYTETFPHRCLQEILFHAGRAFLITAIAESNEFATYYERFERALQSVTLQFVE